MRKRDPIFWGASCIFAVAIVLFAVTQNQLWLFLLAGSYLLRPTLASLSVGRRYVDERQMSIQYRSGNIAFAVVIITCIVLSVTQSAKNDPGWELFNIVVMLGLAARAFSNVILVGNYRASASKMIVAVGLLMTLFSSLEMGNGFSFGALAEMVPGLAIAGIGLLAKKFPRPIGFVVFAVTASLVYVILQKGFTAGQITTALLVSVPLAAAGVGLFFGDRGETEAQS
jgi:hypothetical protein